MEPKRRGLMLVLSSPSGAGKTTLARRLLEAEPGVECRCRARRASSGTARSRGATTTSSTAKPSPACATAASSSNGRCVFDNYYGTPRKPVEAVLADGRDVLFDVDWQGAAEPARDAPDDVVSVFILPPSGRALEQRLTERAQDAPEIVAARMRGASNEIQHWDEYDYVVVNDDIDQALAAVRAILAAERAALHAASLGSRISCRACWPEL